MTFKITAKAQHAEILLYEDIGGWLGGVSAKDFARELKGMSSAKTIDLRLNSAGGDVFEGLAIYRQLVEHPATVTAYVDGLAASIASVIAMAGSKVIISESGFVMIHDANAIAAGGADEMRRTADLLDSTTRAIADVYVARTGLDARQVRRMMAEETWMTSADALANGFAHEVAGNMRMAARLDLTRHHFKRAPVALARPGFDAAQAAVENMGRAISARSSLLEKGKT